MNKVLLLRGFSQYDVMRQWIMNIESAFNKLGIKVIVFDVTLNEKLVWPDELDVDAIIDLNGSCIEVIKSHPLLSNIPYFFILADHPIDHIERINLLKSTDVLTVMDRNDARILEKLGYKLNIYFLPHAALEISPIVYEKELDLTFLGTYSDERLFLKELELYQSPEILSISKHIIQECLHSHKYYLDVFLDLMRESKINISKDENAELLLVARAIGRYIYSYRRNETLKKLAEENFKLDIFGNGWRNSDLCKYNNVTIHDAVNFWQAQDLMKISKIVLNLQGLLVDGTHERVFSGLASGSIVLSNKTLVLEEQFGEYQNVVLFDWGKEYVQFSKIHRLINDSMSYEELFNHSRMMVLGQHTFFERVQTLVAIYQDLYKLS